MRMICCGSTATNKMLGTHIHICVSLVILSTVKNFLPHSHTHFPYVCLCVVGFGNGMKTHFPSLFFCQRTLSHCCSLCSNNALLAYLFRSEYRKNSKIIKRKHNDNYFFAYTHGRRQHTVWLGHGGESIVDP